MSVEEQLALPPDLGRSLEWSNPNSSFGPLIFEITGGLVGWIKPILRESMDLVGVFNDDFHDFSILKNINGDILIQAQANIIGSYAVDDMEKILNINCER